MISIKIWGMLLINIKTFLNSKCSFTGFLLCQWEWKFCERGERGLYMVTSLLQKRAIICNNCYVLLLISKRFSKRDVEFIRSTKKNKITVATMVYGLKGIFEKHFTQSSIRGRGGTTKTKKLVSLSTRHSLRKFESFIDIPICFKQKTQSYILKALISNWFILKVLWNFNQSPKSWLLVIGFSFDNK